MSKESLALLSEIALVCNLLDMGFAYVDEVYE